MASLSFIHFLLGFTIFKAAKLILVAPTTNHDTSPIHNHTFAPYHSNLSSISSTVYLVSSTSPPLPTITYVRPPQSPVQFHAPDEPLSVINPTIHPTNNSINSSSVISDYFSLILNPLAHSEDLGLTNHVSSIVTAQDWHTDNGDPVGGTSNMEFDCPNPLYCNECTDATYFDPPRTIYNGFNFNSMEIGICHSLKDGSFQGRRCECLRSRSTRSICWLTKPAQIPYAIISGRAQMRRM